MIISPYNIDKSYKKKEKKKSGRTKKTSKLDRLARSLVRRYLKAAVILHSLNDRSTGANRCIDFLKCNFSEECTKTRHKRAS